MMRNIYLEGEMGQRFGTGFCVNAPKISDAFSLIEVNDPSFRQYLIDCHENDIGFVIDVAGDQIDYEEELLMPFNEGDITITPVPAGSKGIGKIIMAVVVLYIAYATGSLEAAGMLMGEGSAGLSFWGFKGVLHGFAGLVMLGVAVNLAMMGLMEMLAPDPSSDSDGESSYLFNGSSQNIIEGDPVPVLYGQLRVPGQPIGFEMSGVNAGVNTPWMSRGSTRAPQVFSGSNTSPRR